MTDLEEVEMRRLLTIVIGGFAVGLAILLYAILTGEL